MTRKQKEKAARLWALSLVCFTDCSADTAEANEIRQIAILRAGKELGRLGYSPSELLNEEDCLKAAKGSQTNGGLNPWHIRHFFVFLC